jgi:cyclophilin family peptidyl-prolyl cis-trans isomerase/HEAT repeat protein
MLRKILRRTIPFTFVLAAAACASAPPPPPPPSITFEEKMSAILRLEDRRVLRDPAPPVIPAPPPTDRRAPVVVPPPPPPDLLSLAKDGEARIRRRVALAIGRVGLRDGVEPLVAMLGDPDPEVRQMAAFGLGLIGDRGAVAPLVMALDDASPMVQGAAAEGLGLIGDVSAADALGRLATRVVQTGVLAETPGPDADARRDLPVSAFRLAVYALVRLKAYDQLAAAVLDGSGQPTIRWWPVAYALQRIEDRRALGALLTLAKDPQPYTRAFAAKGLGGIRDPAAIPTLLQLAGSGDLAVVIESVRALGRIGTAAAESATPLLVKMVEARDTHPHVRLEAVEALGAIRAPGVSDLILDALLDSNPAIRAAALRAAAALDPQQFVAVLSGLDPDPVWSVRTATASALAMVPSDVAVPALKTMLADRDPRVIPAVLQALIALKTPMAVDVLLQQLKNDDAAVRAAAATGLGELKPPGAEPALAEAYQFGQRDQSFSARAAALAALSQYGAAAATPVLRTALADKEWAVRLRAALLLKQLDPASAAEVDQVIRPAPTTVPAATYQATSLVDPPVSIAVYIDTDRGTIEIEMAVLDAPLTVENFVRLARMAQFDGLTFHRVVPDFVVQTGDPRGDGEGGPGYTIRDEFNERTYLRGTVGMALDAWGDTGGSQFFITHSPQPHLDARYTIFGRVINGMDVVDQIQQGDVIRRVRVWDGVTSSSPNKN